jgi:hypothetical protein
MKAQLRWRPGFFILYIQCSGFREIVGHEKAAVRYQGAGIASRCVPVQSYILETERS